MDKTLKILFNEDVKTDAELIWRELKKNEIDFKKLLVDNRKDFIAGLKSFNPDLIISDYSLPQFTGMEALVIRNEISPLTPFILVTGSNNETVAVDCMRAGADDYILKDSLSRLGPAIKNAIIKINLLSEKKRTEEALGESEAKYSLVIKNIGEGIGILDTEEKFVFANPAADNIFGVGPGKLEGMHLLRFLSPEGIEIIRKQTDNRRNKKTNIYEVDITLENGNNKQLSVTATPKLDENGNFSGTFGIFRDISERKKAERTLHDIIDNNPMSIQILDADGFTLKVNQAFIKLFGSVPPPDYSMLSDIQLKEKGFAELLERIMNGEVVQFPDMVFNPHDSIPELPDCLLWIKAIGFALVDGNGKPEKIVLMHENIAERKLAEEKVINERIILRSLIDNLPDHIYVKDFKGRKVISNAADYKDLGLQYEQQVIGKTDIELFPGQTGQRGYSDDLEVITSGKPIVARLEDFINSQGEKRWSLATKIPLFDKDGIVTGLVGIGHDITERRKSEEDLIKAKDKAEEGDRLKSAFLANMSHEIRTPMNGILGFAELLKEPGLSGGEQQEYIKIIEKSGARMLNIISEIMDISKIESGQMVVFLHLTNINEKLKDVYKLLKPDADLKKINLSFKSNLSDENAITFTDREKLYSILTNLVKNAIKYTDKGSIEFGCDIVGTIHELSLQFYVKDTGIGIPKDRQKAIFERFIQADIQDVQARQGAGLGLSIANAFVELLGGSIWVESEEGVGSTFYFTLPHQTKPSKDFFDKSNGMNSVKSISNIPIVPQLKILIVEDDETSSKFLSILTKDLYRELLQTTNGFEAIELCRNNPDIDLILMDINMPEMGGYEATRQIRQFNQKVVIIAQTAYGLIGDREKSIRAGCNDYISKPIKSEDMKALIMKYFNKIYY